MCQSSDGFAPETEVCTIKDNMQQTNYNHNTSDPQIGARVKVIPSIWNFDSGFKVIFDSPKEKMSNVWADSALQRHNTYIHINVQIFIYLTRNGTREFHSVNCNQRSLVCSIK